MRHLLAALLLVLFTPAPLVFAEALSRLPFPEGTRFVIADGYQAGGENTFVTFSLAGQTPVVAVGSGAVLVSTLIGSGTNISARVAVQHPNGRVSHYYGLDARGLAVSRRDIVQAGQVLGFASNSLRFGLGELLSGERDRKIPVTFVNGPEFRDRIVPLTGTEGWVDYRRASVERQWIRQVPPAELPWAKHEPASGEQEHPNLNEALRSAFSGDWTGMFWPLVLIGLAFGLLALAMRPRLVFTPRAIAYNLPLGEPEPTEPAETNHPFSEAAARRQVQASRASVTQASLSAQPAAQPELPPPPPKLRPCPDCGREISRRAVACPHCGAPGGG